MTRQDWVRSFAHRSLRGAAGYCDCRHLRLDVEIPLAPQEMLVGVYFNSKIEILDAIGISDCGLHINARMTWRFVAYEDIRDLQLPAKIKEPPFLPAYLDIVLQDHETIRLTIQGRSGEESQFSDVYCIEAFLAGMSRVVGPDTNPAS